MSLIIIADGTGVVTTEHDALMDLDIPDWILDDLADIREWAKSEGLLADFDNAYPQLQAIICPACGSALHPPTRHSCGTEA